MLELAAGLGETGLTAAQLVAPTGGVILSDHAEGMLDGARARAAELELTNVEFQVWNAEWIDLPVASVDAVLCRWGYMLMADPGAALSETRRVLRPGGCVALAVWDAVSANPWALVPRLELIERGLAPAPAPADGRDSSEIDRSRETSPPASIPVRPAHTGAVRARCPRARARPAGAGGLCGGARRGDRRRAAPRELRRLLGDDARHLARAARPRARPARGRRLSRSAPRWRCAWSRTPLRTGRSRSPAARWWRRRVRRACRSCCSGWRMRQPATPHMCGVVDRPHVAGSRQGRMRPCPGQCMHCPDSPSVLLFR